MSLMFDANQILERQTGLTYDDVLLMPRHCEITSRTMPDLSTRVTKNHKLQASFIISKDHFHTILAGHMSTVPYTRLLHRLHADGANWFVFHLTF